MMFASKTPRDLNHDLNPWRVTLGPWRGTRMENQFYADVEHDPRPEFDHVQHNEPNPILVAFRSKRVTQMGVLDSILDALAALDDYADGYWDEGGGIIFHIIEDAQGENPEGYGHAAAWGLEIERNRQADRWVQHARRVLTRLSQIGDNS